MSRPVRASGGRRNQGNIGAPHIARQKQIVVLQHTDDTLDALRFEFLHGLRRQLRIPLVVTNDQLDLVVTPKRSGSGNLDPLLKEHREFRECWRASHWQNHADPEAGRPTPACRQFAGEYALGPEQLLTGYAVFNRSLGVHVG